MGKTSKKTKEDLPATESGNSQDLQLFLHEHLIYHLDSVFTSIVSPYSLPPGELLGKNEEGILLCPDHSEIGKGDLWVWESKHDCSSHLTIYKDTTGKKVNEERSCSPIAEIDRTKFTLFNYRPGESVQQGEGWHDNKCYYVEFRSKGVPNKWSGDIRIYCKNPGDTYDLIRNSMHRKWSLFTRDELFSRLWPQGYNEKLFYQLGDCKVTIAAEKRGIDHSGKILARSTKIHTIETCIKKKLA